MPFSQDSSKSLCQRTPASQAQGKMEANHDLRPRLKTQLNPTVLLGDPFRPTKGRAPRKPQNYSRRITVSHSAPIQRRGSRPPIGQPGSSHAPRMLTVGIPASGSDGGQCSMKGAGQHSPSRVPPEPLLTAHHSRRRRRAADRPKPRERRPCGPAARPPARPRRARPLAAGRIRVRGTRILAVGRGRIRVRGHLGP